jgi:hypothetical protein
LLWSQRERRKSKPCYQRDVKKEHLERAVEGESLPPERWEEDEETLLLERREMKIPTPWERVKKESLLLVGEEKGEILLPERGRKRNPYS